MVGDYVFDLQSGKAAGVATVHMAFEEEQVGFVCPANQPAIVPPFSSLCFALFVIKKA